MLANDVMKVADSCPGMNVTGQYYGQYYGQCYGQVQKIQPQVLSLVAVIVPVSLPNPQLYVSVVPHHFSQTRKSSIVYSSKYFSTKLRNPSATWGNFSLALRIRPMVLVTLGYSSFTLAGCRGDTSCKAR